MKFSYKLALTISLSALITFIVLDVSLIVLYQFILKQHTITEGYNINNFNEFSNQQIIKSAWNNLETGFTIYENVITQIYEIFENFQANPDIYTSSLQRGVNPNLTQIYDSPFYNESSIYFYTDHSTFYDHPYLDRALSVAISDYHPDYTKRVNVIYQSLTDSSDITVRTVPATSDFTVPSIQSIEAKFNNASNYLEISSWYLDALSKSNSTNWLFAIRTLVPEVNDQGYRMLIQIEIQLQALSQYLDKVYSYDSTALALLYIEDSANKKYSLMGHSSKLFNYWDILKLDNYLEPGNYNLTAGEQSYLVTSEKLNAQEEESTSLIAPQGFKNLLLVMILDKSETNLANKAYYEYEESQYVALLEFQFFWSIAVVVLMIGIAYALADYLFSYFGYIKRKCKEYINNPETAESTYFEMKEKASQENHNRLLLQNLISIIQKIEEKKKMNGLTLIDLNRKPKKKSDASDKLNKKGQKSPGREEKEKERKPLFDEYPLNMLCREFQDEMGIKDWERFEKIGKELEARIDAANSVAGKQRTES